MISPAKIAIPILLLVVTVTAKESNQKKIQQETLAHYIE
jgi:hypothetical protein